MTYRTALAAAAAAALMAGCADTPSSEAGAEPRAAGPSAADTSARSPMTVNPAPKGQPLPATPPTLPQEPTPDDKAMPPGPVNPG